MSNVLDLRPEPIRIMLDQERVISFDMEALTALEKHYGSVNNAMAEIQSLVKDDKYVLTVQIFIWCGLATDFIDSKKKLELKDIARYIGLAGVTTLAPLIQKAITAYLPQVDGKNG